VRKYQYARQTEAGIEGCIDRTVYETTRHSHHTSFFTRERTTLTPPVRLISLAAVIGAALLVAIWAKAKNSTSFAPLAGLLPVVM